MQSQKKCGDQKSHLQFHSQAFFPTEQRPEQEQRIGLLPSDPPNPPKQVLSRVAGKVGEVGMLLMLSARLASTSECGEGMQIPELYLLS